MKCRTRVGVVNICVGLLCILLAGCTSSRKTVQVTSESTPLEALGYDQQLAIELAQTPNDFIIPYPDATYAFERGRLFFNRFGGGVALSMRGKNESILGARKGLVNYRYSLTRRDSPRGAQFSVSCQRVRPDIQNPDNQIFEPDLNGFQCKNFARFIKTGQIEDKLVTAILVE